MVRCIDGVQLMMRSGVVCRACERQCRAQARGGGAAAGSWICGTVIAPAYCSIHLPGIV
jgi:hypothetical protein